MNSSAILWLLGTSGFTASLADSNRVTHSPSAVYHQVPYLVLCTKIDQQIWFLSHLSAKVVYPIFNIRKVNHIAFNKCIHYFEGNYECCQTFADIIVKSCQKSVRVQHEFVWHICATMYYQKRVSHCNLITIPRLYNKADTPTSYISLFDNYLAGKCQLSYLPGWRRKLESSECELGSSYGWAMYRRVCVLHRPCCQH